VRTALGVGDLVAQLYRGADKLGKRRVDVFSQLKELLFVVFLTSLPKPVREDSAGEMLLKGAEYIAVGLRHRVEQAFYVDWFDTKAGNSSQIIAIF
jgi:hypothetical protein